MQRELEQQKVTLELSIAQERAEAERTRNEIDAKTKAGVQNIDAEAKAM